MTNPFALLNVDRAASKQDILQQVTVALRSRQHEAKSIAEAQKRLVNSVTRGAEEFKQFLDVESCIGDVRPRVPTTAETPEIALLDTFQ